MPIRDAGTDYPISRSMTVPRSVFPDWLVGVGGSNGAEVAY